MRAIVALAIAFSTACGPAPVPVRTTDVAPAGSPPADVRAALARDGSIDAAECERLLAAAAAREDAVLRGDVAARCGRDTEALRAYAQAWEDGNRACALALAIAELRERTGDAAGARAVLEAVTCRAARLRSADLDLASDPGAVESTDAAPLWRDANDAEALASLVAVHVARAEHELAERVCEWASERDDVRLWLACARAALAAGRIGDAEASYRRALASEPSVEAHIELGDLRIQQRQIAEAGVEFRAALALDAGSYEATLGLARSLRVQGCREAADLAFDRAVTLQPERPETFWYRAIDFNPVESLEEPETTAAIVALRRFVELARDDPRFRADVEEVTRTCRRAPVTSAGRRSWRRRHGRGQDVWVGGCQPGILQRIELSSDPGLRPELTEMARRIELQRDRDARRAAAVCDLPWRGSALADAP